MKTLANEQDKREIVDRLGRIGPDATRQWGAMTVAEMVCHLSDVFKVAMGEKPAQPVSNRFMRTGLMKWIALRAPMRWPRGVATVPECEAGKGGTPPAVLERDLHHACELLHRFTLEERDFEFAEHPFFGEMTNDEWLRWAYLHTDHHLRQFGL